MPYIPHTQQETEDMLAAIGLKDIADLFAEIPVDLRVNGLPSLPEGMNEMALGRLMQARAKRDHVELNFIGAGAYEHHIPAAVWDLASRGEFLTAYTPYQAEASQGTLQLLYEFQTMMANLVDLDVANASLYDGATAVAEAILMAIRSQRQTKSTRVLLCASLHPAYRQVVQTIVSQQDIELIELAIDFKTGQTDLTCLDNYTAEAFAAVVIPQINYFGILEPVDQLCDWAHQHHAKTIAVVNPMSLALLKPPGAWGEQGADIACGEGQPLGIPLASGGPYFGFLSTRQALVRQMPGRIVGRTVDQNGKQGFTLTLQAREQHIRRAKATSNICTNQGLLVTAATIYLSLLGSEGLARVARNSHANTQQLSQLLCAIPGVEPVFSSPFFHEVVLRLPHDANIVLAELAALGIQGGVALGADYSELDNCILLCATETKTTEDLKQYANSLAKLLSQPGE